MKTLVVLLASDISAYAFKPLKDDNQPAFLSAYSRALQLPDAERCIVAAPAAEYTLLKQECAGKIPEGSMIALPEATAAALFTALLPDAAETDHLFFVWADAPFLDVQAAAQLYEQHCTYRAEYSFADGYPEGLLPQLLDRRMVALLAKLPHAQEAPLTRTFLFDLIKPDINAYDLETMIAPQDVRQFRLHFYTDTKAAWLLCRSFTDITAENYARLIQARQECLRPLPAYYGIETVACHPLASLYRPPMVSNCFDPKLCMDLSRIQRIADSIAAFSETAVISLSLYGDPLLHPRVVDTIAHILSYPSLSVLIETSGIAGSHELYSAIREKVSAAPARSSVYLPIYWIVGIDAVSAPLYGRVHQLSEAQAELSLKQAAAAACELASLFPNSVWAQMIRMNENEAELEAFYRLWEKQAAHPLIQKYDHLCGQLPDRRTADLSPLERHACWHLKRDMSICNDGSVPLCKEDIGKSILLGNVFVDSLDSIWQNGSKYYQEQAKSVYKGLCGTCDEYYTYNF